MILASYNPSQHTDNGGIRGLLPLLILREILYTLKEEEGLADIPRPCEVFDLAGGTGTGGYVVIIIHTKSTPLSCILVHKVEDIHIPPTSHDFPISQKSRNL